MEEIVVLFGVSPKALYDILKRNNIKKDPLPISLLLLPVIISLKLVVKVLYDN